MYNLYSIVPGKANIKVCLALLKKNIYFVMIKPVASEVVTFETSS